MSRDRSVERRIIERLEKGDDLALTSTSHIELAKQRIQFLRRDVRIQSPLLKPAATSPTPSADAPVEVDDLLSDVKTPLCMYGPSVSAQVAQRRRPEGIKSGRPCRNRIRQACALSGTPSTCGVKSENIGPLWQLTHPADSKRSMPAHLLRGHRVVSPRM